MKGYYARTDCTIERVILAPSVEGMREAHDNPIRAITRRLVAELDVPTLEAAEASTARYSRDVVGFPMALPEVLDLWGAARVLGSHVGLGVGERQALTLLLVKYDVPDVVRAHVLERPASPDGIEHVHALFSPGSRAARHLLSVVASLASYEGLRADVRRRVEQAGQDLGLRPDLVRVLIEEAQVTVAAILRGDDSTLRRLQWLRYAIFDLDAEPR